MITVAQIRGGAGYMSRHLSMNDYYSEGEEVAGHWHGRAAERLGIAGDPVSKDVFDALASNKHPSTGERLRPRRGEIAYHDFVISAPKSVSIAAMTGGDQRLLEAYDRCAMRAFKRLESHAACRVRAGEAYHTEQMRVTGNGVAAVFRHDTSRLLDPQLHTHMVFANLTWDDESNRWLALQWRIMSEEGAASIRPRFYRELEQECRKLGYDTERSGEAFRLSAISPAAEERLSQRTLQKKAFEERYREVFGHLPDKKRVEQFIKEGKSAATSRFRTEFEATFGHKPDPETVNSFVRDWRSAKMATSTADRVHELQRERLGGIEYETLRLTTQQALASKQSSLEGERHPEQEPNQEVGEGFKRSFETKLNDEKRLVNKGQVTTKTTQLGHQERSRLVSTGQVEAMRRMRRGMSIASALRGHPAGILLRQLTIYARRQNEGRTIH